MSGKFFLSTSKAAEKFANSFGDTRELKTALVEEYPDIQFPTDFHSYGCVHFHLRGLCFVYKTFGMDAALSKTAIELHASARALPKLLSSIENSRAAFSLVVSRSSIPLADTDSRLCYGTGFDSHLDAANPDVAYSSSDRASITILGSIEGILETLYMDLGESKMGTKISSPWCLYEELVLKQIN